jgi:hypothetical protein
LTVIGSIAFLKDLTIARLTASNALATTSFTLLEVGARYGA